MAEKEVIWYWVKINGEWSPAVKDETAVGGWTNLDTWEDFWHEVTDSIKITPPPNGIELIDSSKTMREQATSLHEATEALVKTYINKTGKDEAEIKALIAAS